MNNVVNESIQNFNYSQGVCNSNNNHLYARVAALVTRMMTSITSGVKWIGDSVKSLATRVTTTISSLATRVAVAVGWRRPQGQTVQQGQAIPQDQGIKARPLSPEETWDQYLKKYCDVTANCDLNDAKIFFIGEEHTDYIHRFVEGHLIAHYRNQTGKNLLLLEGGLSGFSDDKCLVIDGWDNLVIESWENKKHYQEHAEIDDRYKDLIKEFKSEEISMELELGSIKLEQDNINNGRGGLFGVIKSFVKGIKILYQAKATIERIEDISKKLEAISKENNVLKKVRDEDLIAKVKSCAMNQNQKIFIIAGRSHILEDDYKIINFFNDLPCAAISLKQTELGKKKISEYVENTAKYGKAVSYGSNVSAYYVLSALSNSFGPAA